MSDAAFDVVRAIERDHIRAVAVETKAREEAMAAHIANLQHQLKTAQKLSSSCSDQSTVLAEASNFVRDPASNNCCDKKSSVMTPHLEPLNKGETFFPPVRIEYGSPTQPASQESSHLTDDDPFEALGRLVESKLGRQVILLVKIYRICVD